MVTRSVRFRLAALLATLAVVVGACGGSDDSSGAGDSGNEGKSGSAKLGITSPSMGYLPLLMAIDRMNEMGYEIEVVQVIDTATLLQTVNDGLVDIVASTAGSGLPAMDAGLDIKFFVERVGFEFNLVGKATEDQCGLVDGGNYGTNARNDVTFLLTEYYLSETCPNAEPKLQVIPGSEVRSAALLEDQLDVTILDLQEQSRLEMLAPGEFEVYADFVSELPLIGGFVGASPEWLSENEVIVKDLIRSLLDVEEEIYDDPSLLLEEAEERLPEVDPKLLEIVVPTYLDSSLYDPTGGLSEEDAQYTLDFYGEIADFQNLSSPDDVIDRTILDSVLADR